MGNGFGVGISGAGVIGKVHADALAGVDNTSLVAVAEPREDAGRAFAEAYGRPGTQRLKKCSPIRPSTS
jgi:predicted dehydrogenase